MIFASEIYGNDVFCYSRKMAIENGELIDLTEAAKVAGFKLPVAITKAAFIRCLEWIQINENQKTTKDKITRLRTMLRRIYLECRRNPWVSSFICGFVKSPEPFSQFDLKIVISGGDNGEGVITIMSPQES